MKEKVSFTIDGKTCYAKEGENLVDAAKENGVYIPTLCYAKEVLGTCRGCIVRNGKSIIPACTCKVTEGMNIEVDSPDLNDYRLSIIELLFVEGNHYCPSCEKSGRCKLQAIAYDMKMMVPRLPYRYPLRNLDYGAKNILLEHNRCIQCLLCVEEVKGENGESVFSPVQRGPNTYIQMDCKQADKLSEKEVDRAVSLCPVGALLKKGKGFDKPYGKRRYDKTPISKVRDDE